MSGARNREVLGEGSAAVAGMSESEQANILAWKWECLCQQKWDRKKHRENEGEMSRL